MKKPDEIALWEMVMSGEWARDAGKALGIHPKRVWRLCEKWSDKGIYEYGTSADLGWPAENSDIASEWLRKHEKLKSERS